MNSRAKRALSADQAELLRQIPSVDELLQRPRLASLASRVDRALLLEITRAALADLREEISGERRLSIVSLSANASSLEERLASFGDRILARPLEPGINATGVILSPK